MNVAVKAVEFSGVTKRYGRTTAVDAISFQVEAGTMVTLLGPSGCGKTTTLRMIAGLEIATAGRISIGGVDVTHLPPTSRDVSMVFQSYALFPHLTVLDNVMYGLVSSKWEKTRAEAKAREGLALVGLADFGARLPSELSGGQQQRVAVARALVLEPKVLLFDEPLSNLDARLRRQMREDIRALQQKLGLTAVYVTHDREEALAVSDKIILMNRAAITQEGSPSDLYERPQSAFAAQFLGEANIVSARGVWIDGALTLQIDKASVTLSTEHVAHLTPWNGERAVELAVRPHAVVLAPAGDAFATIQRATYLGNVWEYAVTLGGIEMLVVAPASRRFIAGQRVYVSFQEHGIAAIASS